MTPHQMASNEPSEFFADLVGLSTYRNAGSRRAGVLQRAAKTHNLVAVQHIFDLCDCGRFEELGVALQNLSPATMDVDQLSLLTKSQRKKLKGVGKWYRDAWLHVEDRVSLQDYSIEGTESRTDYLLLLAKSGELRLLAADLRANFRAYRSTDSVPQNVLIFCFRTVIESPFVSRFGLHHLYRVSENLWEEQDVLDTLVRHWDMVKGNLVLECALHTTAARLEDLDVQRLARRHSGLDLELVATPEQPAKTVPSPGSTNEKPRVAVCISGMLRDADNGAAAMRRNIIMPLDADVFVDTWDVEQTWIGLGGSTGMARVLGNELAKLLPAKIRRVDAFSASFPAVAKVWGTPTSSKIKKERTDELYAPTQARLEPDSSFVESIESYEGLRNNGTFNQARMFYKVNRCFDLMASHEKREGFEYDYVIRIRPDFIVKEKLTLDELAPLAPDEVRVDWAGEVGPSDMFAVGHRSAMETYSQLWHTMLASNRVSPFVAFPEVRSHRLLFLWLQLNNINMSVSSLESELSKGLGACVPGVPAEIAKDLAGPARDFADASWVEQFFAVAAQRGGGDVLDQAQDKPKPSAFQSVARLFRS